MLFCEVYVEVRVRLGHEIVLKESYVAVSKLNLLERPISHHCGQKRVQTKFTIVVLTLNIYKTFPVKSAENPSLLF